MTRVQHDISAATEPLRSISVWAPKHWLFWLGMLLWRGLSMLPLAVLSAFGALIGDVLRLTLSERRRVTRRNVDLCFPELKESERATLVRQCFRHTGQSLFDTGVLAWSSSNRINRLVDIEGSEHLDQLRANKQNAILLAPHFVCVGGCSLVLSRRYPVFAMFKAPKSLLFSAVYRRVAGGELTGRPWVDRIFAPGIDDQELSLRLVEHRSAMGPLVRRLRRGEMLYYASDQNLGRRQTVVAPFFGIPTATVAAASRLTRISEAVVVPVALFQKPRGKGYRLVIHEPIVFDGDIDAIGESTILNHAIERLVRIAPSQYFWLHKRFKPIDDEQPSYY